MRLLLVATLLLGSASAASAETLTMVCKNPHESYIAKFTSTPRTLVLDPDTSRTAYSVLAVEQAATGPVVVGMVGHQSGLTYVADFGAASRSIKFYDDAGLAQTDACGPDLGM